MAADLEKNIKNFAKEQLKIIMVDRIKYVARTSPDCNHDEQFADLLLAELCKEGPRHFNKLYHDYYQNRDPEIVAKINVIVLPGRSATCALSHSFMSTGDLICKLNCCYARLFKSRVKRNLDNIVREYINRHASMSDESIHEITARCLACKCKESPYEIDKDVFEMGTGPAVGDDD